MENLSRELPSTFRVDIEPDRELVSVAPRGELDVATAPELRRAVQELQDAGFTAIRLDLRHLEFMDSCGLRLILQLASDDRLALCVIPGPAGVRRVFEVCGVMDSVRFLPAPRPPEILSVAA